MCDEKVVTLDISIDRSLDPDGRSPALIEAFLHCTGRTSIPQASAMGLCLTWVYGELTKERSHASAVEAALGSLKWDWQDFEVFAATLERDNLWPTPWHHYEKTIKDHRRSRAAIKAKILMKSIRTAAVSRSNFHEPSFLSEVVVGGWHIYTDSTVGAHYAAKFAAQVRPNDPATWPPLYPGDVSRLEATGRGEVYSKDGLHTGLAEHRPLFVTGKPSVW